MNKDSDIRQLQQLLESYEYGKHHLKSDDVEVIYNPMFDSLAIKNFYALGQFLKKGTCVELMDTVCLETKKLYPQYSIIRARGHEPRFFFQKTNHHFFNLLTEEKMFEETFIKDKKNIARLLKQHDPWIIDASFQYIGKLSDTDYIIDTLYNDSFPQAIENTAKITSPTNLIPIGITADNQAVYISMSPKYNETFQIAIQSIFDYEMQVFPINSKRLLDIIKCENNIKTIEILKNKEKKISILPIEKTTKVLYG